MAGHDSYTPRTTEEPPLFGGLLKSYRTERLLTPETPLPAVGTLVGAGWGSAFSNNLVTAAGSVPKDGRMMGWITHVSAPASSSTQNASNYAFSTDRKTLTRTWVMRRSSYSDVEWTPPAIGTADGTYTSYKFGSQQMVDAGDEVLQRYHVVITRTYALENETIRQTKETRPGIITTSTTTIKDAIPGSGNFNATLEERGWLVTAESASIRAGTITQNVDARPYGTLTTSATYSDTSTVPNPGTGSSRLVYDDGTTVIFENTEDSLVAREGASAGMSINGQPWGQVRTTNTFTTSSTITGPGSLRVVYNDGITVVYEKGEEIALLTNPNGGEERERKPYADFVTTITYSTSPSVTAATGTARVAYNDGQTIIYANENTTATARSGSGGTEIRTTAWGYVATALTYGTSATLGGPGFVKVAYNDGTITVYEKGEETASLTNSDAGSFISAFAWGTLTTTNTYSTSSNISTATGTARVVYNDGGDIIYEVGTEVPTPSNATLTRSKRTDPYITTTRESRYSTTPTSSSDDFDIRIAWTNGATTVYEIDETVVAERPAREWVEYLPVEWPPVLKSLTAINWPLVGGGADVFVDMVWEQGQHEVQKVYVKRWWQADIPNEATFFDATEPMVTNGFSVEWPRFSMTVPRCLHAGGTLTFTVPTGDDRYAAGTVEKTIAPTVPNTWVKEKIWYETREHLDGWYITRYEARCPTWPNVPTTLVFLASDPIAPA